MLNAIRIQNARNRMPVLNQGEFLFRSLFGWFLRPGSHEFRNSLDLNQLLHPPRRTYPCSAVVRAEKRHVRLEDSLLILGAVDLLLELLMGGPLFSLHCINLWAGHGLAEAHHVRI